MTVIYDTYYPNISAGNIDLKNVNFSAFIVDESYEADPSHLKSQITGKVETLVKVLVGGDISTLTMGEIVDKVKSKLSNEEYEKAVGFVVYDIATHKLCFYESFNKPVIDG